MTRNRFNQIDPLGAGIINRGTRFTDQQTT